MDGTARTHIKSRARTRFDMAVVFELAVRGDHGRHTDTALTRHAANARQACAGGIHAFGDSLRQLGGNMLIERSHGSLQSVQIVTAYTNTDIKFKYLCRINLSVLILYW
jgi:hypothetical protein